MMQLLNYRLIARLLQELFQMKFDDKKI